MSVDAAAADRLPWLADEPAPQPPKRRRGNALMWTAAAAAALVVGGGYWIGTRNIQGPASGPARRVEVSTSVHLPPVSRPASPQVGIPVQPEVRPAPLVEVRPSPMRQVHIPSPVAQRPEPRAEPRPSRSKVSTEKSAPPALLPTAASGIANVQPQPEPPLPKPWNPRFVSHAAGRLVQVGAFGSVHQAKRGWWFMVHDYPAMAHLPAVVRETRNSRGRAFYRFDVGTTSQAHSEVLCQRMTRVGLSCAVIGLPWKAKVER